MHQGGQISDLGNNQVEVWNDRDYQGQARHRGATSQGPDQADPLTEISDEEGEEKSQTSKEWQLNTSRLVGEVNDGIPPYFTPAEIEFMFVEGVKHRVKYKPAPGARRKSKQQQRTARWRSDHRQQSIRDAVCPTWGQGKKPSATDPPAGIRKYMKKLQPSVLELQARVSKD